MVAYNTVLYGLAILFALVFSLAFILPAVIDSIINQSIDEQVVIDGVNAPNYQSWQTNVNGPGEEVHELLL